MDDTICKSPAAQTSAYFPFYDARWCCSGGLGTPGFGEFRQLRHPLPALDSDLD